VAHSTFASSAKIRNINISRITNFRAGHLPLYIFYSCTHGVTYDNPPYSPLFDDFHSKKAQPAVVAASKVPASVPMADMTGENSMLAMLIGSMAAFVTMFQQGSIRQPGISSLLQPPLMSQMQATTTDIIESGPKITYSEIQLFFQKVADDNP
jgi:hypothetical protein